MDQKIANTSDHDLLTRIDERLANFIIEVRDTSKQSSYKVSRLETRVDGIETYNNILKGHIDGVKTSGRVINAILGIAIAAVGVFVAINS